MLSKKEKKRNFKFKREMRGISRELDKNIAELTRDTTESIKLAAECKIQGLDAQYAKALNQVKFNMNTRIKYMSLKMDLKMAMQLRNTMQIVKNFAGSMNRWTKSIAKISKDLNINAVANNVEETTSIIEEKNQELEELTDTISVGFSDIVESDNKDYVGNSDAEKLVDNYIATGGAHRVSSPTTTEEIEKIRRMLDGDDK